MGLDDELLSALPVECSGSLPTDMKSASLQAQNDEYQKPVILGMNQLPIIHILSHY